MPIGNYGGSDDPNESLRKEFSMTDVAKKKAKRARDLVQAELMKLGATAADILEGSIGITTLVENIGGMPAGVTMGLDPITAAIHLEVGELHLSARHKAPDYMAKFAAKVAGPVVPAAELPVETPAAVPASAAAVPAPAVTPPARPERRK